MCEDRQIWEDTCHVTKKSQQLKWINLRELQYLEMELRTDYAGCGLAFGLLCSAEMVKESLLERSECMPSTDYLILKLGLVVTCSSCAAFLQRVKAAGNHAGPVLHTR